MGAVEDITWEIQRQSAPIYSWGERGPLGHTVGKTTIYGTIKFEHKIIADPGRSFNIKITIEGKTRIIYGVVITKELDKKNNYEFVARDISQVMNEIK